MFTSQPQAVEVYERGGWLPASMLGWRHDGDGACSAWVRVEFAGVVEDAWVELARLRLPESPARHLALARAPKVAASSAGAAGESAREVAETQQLPLVREGGVPLMGRRVPPGGGRRRAAETGEHAVGLPVPLAVLVQGRSVQGRHRAPAEQGRHRAVDTGMLAAVTAGAAVTALPNCAETGLPLTEVDACSTRPARSELPPAGPVIRGLAAREVEGDRLTRPMRLDEGVRSARRARRDSLGV